MQQHSQFWLLIICDKIKANRTVTGLPFCIFFSTEAVYSLLHAFFSKWSMSFEQMVYSVVLLVFMKDDKKLILYLTLYEEDYAFEQLVYPVDLSVLMKDDEKNLSLPHSSLRSVSLKTAGLSRGPVRLFERRQKSLFFT
jgi:hypothetical protein